MDKLSNIPTNIITGALGVGKTTLIQSLLKNKPKNEKWAILVNEFGEVGIDGAMLTGASSRAAAQDIFIKEVPGGCMCCTSGLPMQIALNLLLAEAKPDRLLIEPTGLGHPKEVLATLTQPHYKALLNVQATLTLIDARKLNSERWRSHPTFQEQMKIADILVVTKSDLYEHDHTSQLTQYMSDLEISSTPLIFADKGKIDCQLLSKHVQPKHLDSTDEQTSPHHHAHSSNQEATPLIVPEMGCQRFVNSGQGYYSRGWLCSRHTQFNYQACRRLFESLEVERLKAVLITDQGAISFNKDQETFHESRLESAIDSRIELITNNEKIADDLANTIENVLQLA